MSPLPADLGRVTVWCDGAARGNPGPAGIGAVVVGENGDVLAEVAERIGETTNNVAEYRALLAGLSAARELGAAEVTVCSDSRLLVEQMKGTFRVKNARLRALHAEATALADGFRRFSIRHVPRQQNERADRLANRALDATATGDEGVS